MSRPSRSVPAALLALTLGGCPASPSGGTSPLLGEPISPPPPAPAAPVAAPAPPRPEAVVLGAARALAQGAVDQARAVQGRLLEERTKELAARMIASHGAVLEKLTALEKELGVTGAESATKAEVDRELGALRERLENALDGDIDRIYGETQSALHKGALRVIDDQLLPLAKQEGLAGALRELRGVAVRHLLSAGGGASEPPAGH